MERWLLPRDRKETRTCDSCGSYKMRAKFYNWNHHPSISFMGDGEIGVICTPCAKREAGSRLWRTIKSEWVNERAGVRKLYAKNEINS